MEALKVSYLSDIHIDFFVRQANERAYWEVLEDGKTKHSSVDPIGDVVNKLKNSAELGEILIVAGDIGHKNQQNKEFLEKISIHFKHTYVVLGNHDYYLISSEEYRYLRDSNLRVKEMTEMIKEIPNVTLLTGQIELYKDVRIQGNVAWADGLYLSKTLKSKLDPQEMYTEGVYLGPGQGHVRMNDCVLIKPGHRFDARFKSNSISWAPGEVDIMITHYNPSILKKHQDPDYKDDYLTTFYCFDGKSLMMSKKPKLWVYGHSHNGRSYEHLGCKVVNNAIGYPHEIHTKLAIKTLTLG